MSENAASKLLKEREQRIFDAVALKEPDQRSTILSAITVRTRG